MKDTEEQNEPSSQPAPQNFAAALRAWRYFILILAFAAGVALFYFEENWRGTRKWENYQRELKTQGLPIESSEIVPLSGPGRRELCHDSNSGAAFRFRARHSTLARSKRLRTHQRRLFQL